MRNNATNAGRAGLILTFSLLAALLAGGCSGSANNHSVPFEPGKGHPADFVATHPSFAVAPDCLGCQPCHGYINMTDNVYDLRGGTSRVSCASVSFKGISCHAAGPGAATADHALPGWVDNVHFVSAAADLAGCKRCHGTDLRGQGGAAPSCYSASFTGLACHTGGPDHLLLAATWVVTSTSVPDTVSAHHNATFADGGVSCRQCHAANPPTDNTLSGGKSRDRKSVV